MQPYFFIRRDKKYVRVNYKDVVYIESVGNYVKIVMEKGILLTIATLKELDSLLPPASFCRINRGCIVAVDRIVCFTKETVQLKNIELPLTNRCRKTLESRVTIIPAGQPTYTTPISRSI
ncbi:MAG TPA: LytTR family DNA-binding domain-containing protein [Chitinophagaceae bacterium]|nr:LytTR family DNA-binding domain-containing protein [Chitinophagaceae bacterium]